MPLYRSTTSYGDVDGPASATDNAIARFDGVTGKLIKVSATAASVSEGGTGASTAAGALTNLGAVAKAGDTMTGILTINPGTGVAGLRIGAASLQTDSNSIQLVGGRAEMGYDGTLGNAYLKGSSGKGAVIYTNASTAALTFTSPGNATFAGTTTLNADPTANLHASTKQYTDAKATARQFKTYVTVGTSDADYITDGTADHTEINAAITAVNAAGGGVVFLKAGTYNITSSVTMLSNVTLRGTGSTAIIKVTGTGCHGIMATSISDIEIRDLVVDGNKSLAGNTAGAHNIRLELTTNIKLLNVRLKDSNHHNLISTDCTNLTIDGYHATGAGDPAKIVGADGVNLIIGPRAVNVKISNLTLDNSAYHNLQIYENCIGVYVDKFHITNGSQRSGSGANFQIHPGCQDIILKNGKLSGTIGGGCGIQTETSVGNPINNVHIENVIVSNNHWSGIRIAGTTNFTISGCTIRNSGMDTTASVSNRMGIRILNGTGAYTSTRGIIKGNIIHDNQATATQLRPTSIEGGTDYLVITDNQIYSHVTSNVLYFDPANTGTNFVIANNIEG